MVSDLCRPVQVRQYKYVTVLVVLAQHCFDKVVLQYSTNYTQYQVHVETTGSDTKCGYGSFISVRSALLLFEVGQTGNGTKGSFDFQ